MTKLKNAWCATVALILLSTAATQAQTPQINDQVIAVVGQSPIFLSELEETTKAVAKQRQMMGSLSELSERDEAMEQLLTRALMATCAVLDSLDTQAMPVDEMVENEVARQAMEAGGVKQLEEKAGKPIFQIKADLTLDIKQEQLAGLMEQKIRVETKVNQAYVEKFYSTLELDNTDMIPVQYSYSQIVKTPPQTDQRKYAIREQLLEFRERILAGEISLGALAQLYSADRSSAVRRGEAVLPIRGLAPQITEALESLKPGEVSEIIETEFGFHLAELIAYIETGGEKQIRFRHILLKPEFTVEESRQVAHTLDSLATVIRLGQTTFDEAALKYSDDKNTKQNGGRVFNKNAYMQSGGDITAASTKFVAEELFADFRQISSLKEGEVSGAYESMDDKGNTVQKIIRLDRIIPAHRANLTEDYDLIAALALRHKQKSAINEWVDQNIHRVAIDIKPDFMDFNSTTSSWHNAALRTMNGENLKVKIPTLKELSENWDAKTPPAQKDETTK